MADWPEDAVDAYVARGLAALTPRTVVDPDELRARLEEVRAAGYAWGLQEFAEGIDSVAAPIRDAKGNAVAAIHVHGPAYRFPPRGEEEEVAREVVDSAAAISGSLARDEPTDRGGRSPRAPAAGASPRG